VIGLTESLVNSEKMTLFHAGNARFRNSEKRGRCKYSGLLEQEKYKYKPNNVNFPPFLLETLKADS
jgi:hypothetical protein